MGDGRLHLDRGGRYHAYATLLTYRLHLFIHRNFGWHCDVYHR